jgi:hypothetical protein
MLFLLKTQNPSLTMEKTSTKSHLSVLLQNIWPELLKIVKIIKTKESLKNCQSQEKSED